MNQRQKPKGCAETASWGGWGRSNALDPSASAA